jgi:hypothetical protein
MRLSKARDDDLPRRRAEPAQRFPPNGCPIRRERFMRAISGNTCGGSTGRIRHIPSRPASRKAPARSGYTRRVMYRRSLNCTFLLALLIPGSAYASDLLKHLLEQAPDAPPQVLTLALEARDCATELGAAPPSSRLAVLDYSRPSTERRLWLFDLQNERLLHAEYVAHGRNSGENFAHAFSNDEGSHQSSLGLFLTEGTYNGGNGYSLLLDGLEPGTNDHALARRIVMHGADYVNPLQALRQGRLGRSFGCPALRPQVARAVIDELKNGQLLFAYYPDPEWLARSPYLSCSSRLAQRSAPSGDAGKRPAGS